MEEQDELSYDTQDESVENTKKLAINTDFKVGEFFKSSDPYKLNPGSRERNTPGAFRQETTDIYQAAFDFGRDLRMKKELKSYAERENTRARASIINKNKAPGVGSITSGKQVTGIQGSNVSSPFNPSQITVPTYDKNKGK